MEKAETMRLQACLPQSYWEFALDYATHIYNRTPMRHLAWRTPYQYMTDEVPSLNYLRVFGSAAYVFIPAEVRVNKMSPKSELMTFIGLAPGGHGWLFMRSPNKVVFTAAQATFDEYLFPKCPKTKFHSHTRLHMTAPNTTCDGDHCVGGKHCHCPLYDEEDEPVDHSTIPLGDEGKQRELPSQAETEFPSTEAEPPTARRSPVPITPPLPEEPSPPRRSQCVKRIPKRPGNVYGDKHPVQIELETRKTRDWRKVVQEEAPLPVRRTPGTSALPDVPTLESDSDSEGEVEDSLEPPSEEQAEVSRLCWEGGAALSHFLLAKSITASVAGSEDEVLLNSPKYWTYRDVLRLPPASLKEWKEACEREITTLQDREVFELVKHPRDRKVIKN